MSTQKTLRLRLTALREIGVNPYKEAEMLEFIHSLILPEFVIGNNEGLGNIVKSAKMQCEDIFHKHPLLLGMLESIGIMNEESMLEVTAKYYNDIAIKTIDVGSEIIKWLWRPVIQTTKNIRVGTALIEHSLVRNILLKVDDDVAFIQRQCYSQDLEISMGNLQLISDKSNVKKGSLDNGQIRLFEEQKNNSKVINFPVQSFYMESLDYHIELSTNQK